jgi:hypothetical protein
MRLVPIGFAYSGIFDRIFNCGFLQGARMTSMKQFLVVPLIIAAAFSSASANLGDNYHKVEDSYRNLLERHLRDDGSVSALYRKGRYLSFVIFANGRSVRKAIPTSSVPISPKRRLQDS